MPLLRLLSAAEQAAAHLRGELERGHWGGVMPGVKQLAKELGVNRKTIDAALRQLAHEGLLARQGQGRRCLIARSAMKAVRPLRVAILLHEPGNRHLEYIVELQHALVEAGHAAVFAAKYLTQLNMELGRVRRLFKQTEADAWVIMAAPRDVLEWFSAQAMPAFALFGRREGLPIAAAGPEKPPAFAAATRNLIGLGHRQIVLLARRERRLPVPGKSERAFLDALKAHGIPTGAFNLPDWEETIDGFHGCLHELFRVTPPSALIVDEASFFIAAQQFLARRRLLVPEQVSLICTDADPTFAWCKPSVAHIHWDSDLVIRRIVRWAATVSRGGKDLRQTLTPAEFVPGGTIGPAPANRGD